MKKLIMGAASLMLCAGLQPQDFKINPSGYFENQGANVMVFSDVYPEGHQGGVTLVLNGDRRAAGGDVRFEISQGQWQGLPKMRSRVVDEANNEIRVTLSYPDSTKHMTGFNPMIYPDFVFGYTIKVKGEKDYLVLTVDLDQPVPERFAGKLGFNLELVPSTLLGKPWIMDNQTGVFPHQAMGPTMKQTSNMQHIGDFNPEGKADLNQLLLDRKTYNPMIADDIVSAPLAQGKKFVLNPQDELAKITIESEKGELKLYDGRINHNNGWFVLRSEFPAGTKSGAVKWIIRPTVTKEWRYAPVVQTSQVGYHPAQKKLAVIELDKRDTNFKQPALYRITADGRELVKQQTAKDWGDFLRYHYLQFDFTEVTEGGLYQVMYGDVASPVFRIANDVWEKGIWQAEIEYFLPVQMCHMRVNEKYRVWHDFCHQDDALMAKTDINHIDGYTQGPSTLCKYKPGERVPGLNKGGWHDAGDYDLRIESQAGEAYILAMACENLNAYWDETSIDFDKQIVEIHQPDGKNDFLQQVENGALTIVAGWKALGRLYRGILCPTVRQYAHLGDASAHTDHVSGTADDRWVFTEDNPGRELQVAAWMAGISRVLKGHNDALSADCLEIARELFKITRCDNNRLQTTKVHAAVELYLATKEVVYRDFVLQQQDLICKNILQTGWFIGRFDKAVGNERFSKAIRKALPQLQAMYQEYSNKTPYGVPHDRGNRSSGSWEPQHLGYNYCYLNAAYPDLFAPDYIYDSMQYLLGMHPGRNQSAFVTGVGAETMKAAYGVNRADWSYIPGGVAPGTNLIRPDLPELLRFPFLWQEGEYCLGGHATWFMYMVLASQKILNGNSNPESVESPKFYSKNANPLSDFTFVADPTAIEYNGRLYVYGTNDNQQLEQVGKEGRNTYERIHSLVMLSTDDMVNWTFHGTIDVASISPWGMASWAPSIVSRVEEDGKTHFYLYYSNSGAGVGVLTATSPVGPWTDPLGRCIVSGSTPGLGDCEAPFDPGVVIDENGVGWLSFGGGDKNKSGTDYMPGNTRIVRLGKDMISLDSEIVELKAPYHFEANELNYLNGTWIYTYNTNWKDRTEWPYQQAKPTRCCMSYMTSRTPLDQDSWVYQDNYFKNPGDYGMPFSNNHTHLSKYKGEYYLFYHAMYLQDYKGTKGGFRSLCVDKLRVDEKDLKLNMGEATLKGVTQINPLNPFALQQAETTAATLGVSFEPMGEPGNMVVTGSKDKQSSILVRGVDFSKAPGKLQVQVAGKGKIEVRLDNPEGPVVASIQFDKDKLSSVSAKLKEKVKAGIHDLYFTIGEGDMKFDAWKFIASH